MKYLNKLVEDGWLISQVHPSLDLTIYNYSQKTQYESYWNEYTLMCRGLVVNSEGNIIARPFKKFFNWEEYPESVPVNEPYEIFEKVDGSLGIFFWYNDQPIFSSRGSFTSEQATKGWELLQKYPYEKLTPGYTYLFEIIYPENRIVLDYGKEETLVLLGIIHSESGKELPWEYIKRHYGDSFNLVNRYEIPGGWMDLKALNIPNREGFVIRFENGFRMKIKFADYLELHRVLTGISNINIWETLMNGESFDKLYEIIPDELYDWLKKTKDELVNSYTMLENEYQIITTNLKLSTESRKDFAKLAGSFKYPGLLFSMLDGKDYSKAIWKLVKPNRITPFRDISEI